MLPKRGSQTLIVLLFCLATCRVVNAQDTAKPDIHVIHRSDWANQPKYRPDELLVRFRSGTQTQTMDAAHAAARANSVRSLTSVEGLQVVQVPAGTSLQSALAAYRQNPSVLYAEPNYIVHALGVPDDPLFSQQWNLQNTGQYGGTAGADIHSAQAWTQTTGSANVVVAVIDTGIDYNHSDLFSNVWTNASGYAGTLNGVAINCAPGTHGFNAVASTCDPLDDNGHGTHVSGTIGAIGNNGIGVVGVNWTVQILPCKFLDANGAGDISGAITCLDFVKAMKDSGVNVVASNNSWGGVDFSQALADAIQAQQQDGILFIAAAGNDAETNDFSPFYPADYFLPNLISVAATDRFDNLAYFSDVGLHTVHLGAPGQEILSTTPNNTYSLLSGTSMAAPQVTGVAALLAAFNSKLDWRAIRNLILAGGDTLPSLATTISGKRLDAYGALTCANSPVSSRLQPTQDAIAGTAGQPITLAALNINCAQPAGAVSVTVSPGGQSIPLRDDGTGADQAAGDGIYTAQWTPPGPGDYTLAFPVGNPVQVTVLSNYSVGLAPPTYVTVAGTNLNLGDDDVAKLSSPFPVQFGGGAFNEMYVSANGTISFTNAFNNFLNQPLPLNYLYLENSVNPPPPPSDLPVVTLIAPLWQDLVPIKGSNENVFWGVSGTAPNRQLVVEWRNVRTYLCRDDPNANVTFEAVFSESSSEVQFNYSNVLFGDACADQDFGNAATVGLQISQNVGALWSSDQTALAGGTSLVWTIAPANPPANPVPVITAISPTSIPFGAGDTVVNIIGTGFVPESTVFNLPTIFQSENLLQIVVEGADTTRPLGYSTQIQVFNPAPGGGKSQIVLLPVNGATSQITSISPSSVPAGSFGFVLTINGSGFIDGSDVVFNGSGGGSATLLSRTQITVPVPDAMLLNPTSYNVQIEYPSVAGYSFSNAVPLIVTPAAGAPSAGTISTGGQATPPGTPPLAPARPNVSIPTRFLGWKYAQEFGPEYQAKYGRPRADTAPPAPASSTATGRQLPGVAAGASASSVLPPIPGFNFRPTLPADFLPAAIVTGDFNGDGKMDWAIANAGSNNIWIYLGNGDGTTQLPTIIPLRGLAPVALVAADMNHDGKLDLVVAEADSEMVAVLLGNGDGTFKPELQFAAPGAPISLAVADFNGDSEPDVVAGLLADSFVGQLAFFAGDGTGKLGDPVTQQNFYLPGISYINSIVAADLDGDGLPDIVAIDYVVSLTIGSAGARVYLNQGNGRFKVSQHFFFDDYPVGASTAATAVALADVNKDGCVDAVTTDTDGNATFFPGLCNGTFDVSRKKVFATGIDPASVMLRDVNGDGNLDLVSAAMNIRQGGGGVRDVGDVNSISVQFGDGAGNFGSPSLYHGNSGMFSVALADLNGDGFPEVITANEDSDTASVYLNDGKGGFGAPGGSYLGYLTQGQMNAISIAPTTNFALLDMNGDGHKDLVTFENGAQFPLPGAVTVLLGNGTGKFASPIRSSIFDVYQLANDLAFGDVRNSGLPDLLMVITATTNNPTNYLAFSRNNGDGTFQRPALMPLINQFPIRLVLGDFNGDGKLDAVIASLSSSVLGVPSVALVSMLGRGDGTFVQGNTDIVGSGVLSNGPVIHEMFAGDFNHDGKLDLLVGGNGLINSSEANALYEFLGNGDGTFQPPKLLSNNFGANFTLVDLNHDGLPDIVTATVGPVTASGFPWTYQVYLGNSDGTFRAGASYGPFFNPYAFGVFAGGATDPLDVTQPYVADFNGDGNPDIAVFQSANQELFNVNGSSGSPFFTSLQILAGNGDGTFTPTGYGFSVGRLAVPQLAADVNEDGRADLVQMNAYTSSYEVLTATTGPSFAVGLVSDPVIGANGKIHIVLAYPSASGTTLQLSASDSNISIPASVTFPAGSSAQDIAFQVGTGFNANRVFAITAKLGTEAHTAYGTSVPAPLNAGFDAGILIQGTPVILPSQSTPDYRVIVASFGGYSTTIQLSCDGLPNGAACQFGQNPVQLGPGVEVIIPLIVATQSDVPFGPHPFTIVMTDGFVTAKVSTAFNVGDFSLSLAPTSRTLGTSDFANYTLTIQGLYGYSLAIQIGCGELPAGVACPTSLAGVYAPDSQGVFFQLRSQNAAPGTYTFTIVGTAGPVVHSASAQIIITAGTFAGSVSATSATIPVGGSENFNVQVNSVNNFQGQVSLSCSALLGINCQFAPGLISVSPAAPGSSVLTISISTKPSMTLPSGDEASRKPPRHLAPLLLATIVAVLMIITLGGRLEKIYPRGNVLRFVGPLLLIALIFSVATLSSCGTGGSAAPAGGGNNGGNGGGGGGTGGNPFTSQVIVQGAVGGTMNTLGTISVTVP
jgi:subtilisin family serine protease